MLPTLGRRGELCQLYSVGLNVAALIFLLLSSFLAYAEDGRRGGKLRITALEGSAYNRGVQHGTELRAEITALLQLWKVDLATRFRCAPDQFIQKFLR